MRRVERGKWMRVDAEHLREVLLEAIRAVAGAVAKAGDAQALGQRGQIRQARRELAVDDRQANRARDVDTGNERRRLREGPVRERKLRVRNRRDVREAPVFLPRVRKPDFRKSTGRLLASFPQPCRSLHERLHHCLAPAAVWPA